jgi:hypothetical protein
MRGVHRQGEFAATMGRREIRQHAELIELVQHLAVLSGIIRDDVKAAKERRGKLRKNV